MVGNCGEMGRGVLLLHVSWLALLSGKGLVGGGMGKGAVLLVVVSLIAVPAGDWVVVVPGCTCNDTQDFQVVDTSSIVE